MWTGAAIILLLILALLSIPITLQFIFAWPETSSNSIRLRWAFGLVRMRFRHDGARDRPGEQSESAESPLPKRDFVPVFGERRVRRRTIRFFSDLWGAIHKENVCLRARIGLDDPAETGQLWAVLGPLAGALSMIRSASIVLEPDFLNSVLDVDARGRIRFIPIRLIGLVLAMPFSPAFWIAIRRLRSTG